jgi:hypothetical protein
MSDLRKSVRAGTAKSEILLTGMQEGRTQSNSKDMGKSLPQKDEENEEHQGQYRSTSTAVPGIQKAGQDGRKSRLGLHPLDEETAI